MSAARGHFRFEKSFEEPRRCRLLAHVNGYFESLKVYDAGARLWRVAQVEPTLSKSLWTKLLAQTVYNPSRDMRIVWAPSFEYPISELRDAYASAVERDDDILTQFVEAEELVQRIRAAGDFASLAKVYRWASTDHD